MKVGLSNMNDSPVAITERRRQTRNSIYRCVYDAENPLSKQDISQQLGLSLPTVHQNITELAETGLIKLGGMQRSTGGRRARGYAIVEDARFAVGIYLTADCIHFVAADLRLYEIAYMKRRVAELLESKELGIKIARDLESFLDENGLQREKLLGVGIAVPGVIDTKKDRIFFAPTMKKNGFLLSDLIDKMPYPSHVDNDGNSGGFAEWFLSNDKKSIAYLSLEEGVGGAVLLQGERYLGEKNRSGEFGHMCVQPNGLPCRCGRLGCLEAYCSVSRISTDMGITIEEFFEGLEQGNKTNNSIWSSLIEHLAIGVNNIYVALDCDVILGGQLSEYLTPYLSDLRCCAAKLNPFSDDADYIELSRFPRRAIMLGVALHYVQDFIERL